MFDLEKPETRFPVSIRKVVELRFFFTRPRIFQIPGSLFRRQPTWSASRRHVMLCYKSDPKHYTIRTPTARWWFRARQLCCRGPSTSPTTNFYKKQSSKKSISGFTRSILLKIYFITKTEIREEQQQMLICIEIPIVMDYEKWHAIFCSFSSL